MATIQSADREIDYVFEALSGESYLIEVQQQGLDFIITIIDPSGISRSYDSPLERDEPEYVLVDAARNGTYRISVGSNLLTDAQGSHVIHIQSLRGIHKSEHDAWRLMTLGAAANANDTREVKLTAIDAYDEAARLWRDLRNPRLEAQALYSVAMLKYAVAYDRSAAAELAADVAELYRKQNETSLRAKGLFLQAISLMEVASELQVDDAGALFDQALDLFDRSRRIQEPLGNIYELGQINTYLGLLHFRMGRWTEARSFWSQAAPQFLSIGEWREELNVQQNLAVLDLEQAHYASAIETFRHISDRLPAEEDPELRAIILENLAASYRESGYIEEGLRGYSDALELYRKVGDRVGEAYALRGIGTTYFASGELDLAQQLFEQSLPIAEDTRDGRLQAAVLTSLGNSAYLEGNFVAALEFHESALSLTYSRPDEAYRKILIAKDLAALGRPDEAINAADTARATSAELNQLLYLADAHSVLGRASLDRSALSRAEQHFAQALRLYSSLGVDPGEADALNGLAMTARERGDLKQAIDYSTQSIAHAEKLRESMTAPQLRAFYSASRRAYYEAHIELLMEQHAATGALRGEELREALTISERVRARMTRDLLSEAEAAIEEDSDNALIQERQNLLEQLAALQYRKDGVLNRDRLDEENRSEIDQILDEMRVVETKLNVLEAELRRTSPAYANMVFPDPLSLSEIQEQLDEDTLLLQYWVGEARGFVWVVTGDAVAVHELASRSSIETVARRAFEGLKNRQDDSSARRRLSEDLAALADLVLPPVAMLRDKRRILVAADGALQYIPFAVLPMNVKGATAHLVDSLEIVTVPSMSVLAALRSRGAGKEPKNTLAVFADPVFEQADPRFAGAELMATVPQAVSTDLLTRSSVATRLTRIPATGQEANAIGALVPADKRYVARGFAASRAGLFDLDLSEFQYIHFATHGLVDSRYPALSALALSSFDAQGRPQNGFLRLDDIYGLKLNADLVVLSACETGLGREIRGEGLIGLAQAFLSAGARGLVVSLWQVPDRATAELMTRFYTYLFDGGLSPAAALREAQRSLAAEPRWNDPYFWGGFLLVGDWR